MASNFERRLAKVEAENAGKSGSAVVVFFKHDGKAPPLGQAAEIEQAKRDGKQIMVVHFVACPAGTVPPLSSSVH